VRILPLDSVGSPVYADVTAGTFVRAGTSGSEIGVLFDGTGDVLFTDKPLNQPSDLETLVSGYPINYTGITVRGMQMWVYPEQAGINAGDFQSIVSDTIMGGARRSARRANGRKSVRNTSMARTSKTRTILFL